MVYKLFVGGLNTQQTEKDLKAYFSHFGDLKTIKIIRDKDNRSKCYGFVWVGDEKTQERILQIPRHVIGGRVIDVNTVIDSKKQSLYRQQLVRERKLFVGGLAQETSSDDLLRFFSQFGELKAAFVIYEPRSQVSKRFGYIEFFDPESALHVLDRTDLILHGFNISCRRFGDKEGQLNRRRKLVSDCPETQELIQPSNKSSAGMKQLLKRIQGGQSFEQTTLSRQKSFGASDSLSSKGSDQSPQVTSIGKSSQASCKNRMATQAVATRRQRRLAVPKYFQGFEPVSYVFQSSPQRYISEGNLRLNW